MITNLVAGVRTVRSGAPDGYVGKHRAPCTRHADTVRMPPVPAPTRMPELRIGGR